MYDFFEGIICSHSLWEWFKDIIIPAAGAIAIPVLIWWFGAEKAEERKNQRLLNERLNYLYAILYISNQNLDSVLNQTKYEERVLHAYIKRNWVEFPDIFDAVIVKDYSLASYYDINILKNLTEAKNEYKKLQLAIDKLSEIATQSNVIGLHSEMHDQIITVRSRAKSTKTILKKAYRNCRKYS